MQFNFDLNKVEKHLSRLNLRVGAAADFNEVRNNPIQTASVFVLPLDDDYAPEDAVTGQQIYNITELFAVMIVIPCHGGNQRANDHIAQLRNLIKAELAGVKFGDWQPIEPHRGRIVEFNHKTNTLIYQCQFKVTGYVTVNTRPMP
ncbi:phage tail terminator protein [Pseudoalteromonas 'SMAR']|uniref:phage tail terminator protein n=1 Tax=Pseudoalteromonas 'SMAR' TaxID=3416908 RepID=UPI003AF2F083